MDTTTIAIITVIVLCAGIPVAVAIGLYTRNTRKAKQLNNHAKAKAEPVEATYQINGRYIVKQVVHKQGGMAAVWLATVRKTGLPCIVKTPRRGTQMDNLYLDKLMLEAGFLKQLDHPNIVKHIDDFYYNGEFHLVIEKVDGDTMLSLSPRVPSDEGAVLDWARQLMDAIAYIHSKGIIHRDINPKNIMLDSNNTVRLIDFGTARKTGSADKNGMVAAPFTQIANRGFDIPELFMGGTTDGRCDLCGLAQTCIYLLTLRQPNDLCTDLFMANWPRNWEDAGRLADYLISTGVSRRTSRCLAQAIMFNPDNRFADAGAMLTALISTSVPSFKAVEASR